MNRLQAELQRLFLLQDGERPVSHPGEPGLIGADGRVRALVLELGRPASWDVLAKMWQGVQADLELPAPAIAISGIDSYQLWFSLAQPLPAAQATAFLESLRRRYLPDVAPNRIAMHPSVDASAPSRTRHVSVMPPIEAMAGRWSAFVTPDLAGLFADEPWLDLPPSPDAQADLLSRLQSTKADDLKRASERLAPVVTPVPARSEPAANGADPRRFLLDIMNDPAIELHLRIEAAKALLPYFDDQRPD
jgi:hypothetical protein